MPLFLAYCTDKPDAVDLRLATRPAHLDYLHARTDVVKMAGPFSDDAGDMIGSMLILETADKAAAEAFVAADPYALAGLFEAVSVRAWRCTVGTPPA